MREDLKYPSEEAIKTVLTKIGVEPLSRIDQHDQDAEYTSCELSELDLYIKPYKKSDTSDKEKRVLECYLLECLNEYIQNHNNPHTLQEEAFSLLFSDMEIHDTEISYWSSREDPNRENWLPIAEMLSQWSEKCT